MSEWVDCPECMGLGRILVEHTNGGVANYSPWQSYKGEWRRCEHCAGDGEVRVDDE